MAYTHYHTIQDAHNSNTQVGESDHERSRYVGCNQGLSESMTVMITTNQKQQQYE